MMGTIIYHAIFIVLKGSVYFFSGAITNVK